MNHEVKQAPEAQPQSATTPNGGNKTVKVSRVVIVANKPSEGNKASE